MAGTETGDGVDPLAVALGLLSADAPATITGAPEDWPRWAVLLPHVLTATEHVDDTLDLATAGPDGPRIADDCSWLLDRAATYLQVHVRLQEARPLAERALAERALTIAENTYGPEHPDVGTRLKNLALIRQDLGDPPATRPGRQEDERRSTDEVETM